MLEIWIWIENVEKNIEAQNFDFVGQQNGDLFFSNLKWVIAIWVI